MKKRMKPGDRHEQLLTVALELSRTKGYDRVTKLQIAEKAEVVHSLVNVYFLNMEKLRRDIMRAAIERECIEVIAQGLVNGDKYARKAPTKIKKKAAALLLEE